MHAWTRGFAASMISVISVHIIRGFFFLGGGEPFSQFCVLFFLNYFVERGFACLNSFVSGCLIFLVPVFREMLFL